MVKIKGALLGRAPRGHLAHAIVFVRGRRRIIVKRWAKPAQKRQTAQQGMQIYLAWLSSNWRKIDAYAKYLWKIYARTLGLSAFNAFMSANLMLMAAGYPPRARPGKKVYLSGGPGMPHLIGRSIGLKITIHISAGIGPKPLAYIIHASQERNIFKLRPENAIAVIDYRQDPETFEFKVPKPGTWHIRVYAFHPSYVHASTSDPLTLQVKQ